MPNLGNNDKIIQNLHSDNIFTTLNAINQFYCIAGKFKGSSPILGLKWLKALSDRTLNNNPVEIRLKEAISSLKNKWKTSEGFSYIISEKLDSIHASLLSLLKKTGGQSIKFPEYINIIFRENKKNSSFSVSDHPLKLHCQA